VRRAIERLTGGTSSGTIPAADQTATPEAPQKAE
jgi:hypothetical protein